MLNTWIETQPFLALSSGEREFYAALKVSAGGVGVGSRPEGSHHEVNGDVLGYASATQGVIHRLGLGRTRHIDSGLLWAQPATAEKGLQYSRALGTTNLADVMTKYLSAGANWSHCTRLGVQFESGRVKAAH